MLSIIHYARKCLHNENPIEDFFKLQLSQLFTFFPYDPWLAFFGKFVNIIATFSWNYMDLFVVMISCGLSSRFKQINEDMRRIKGEVKPKKKILLNNKVKHKM